MRQCKTSPLPSSAPTDPLDKFDLIFYRVLSFMIGFCGLNVMDPNFRITTYTVIFALYVVMAVLGVIYTVWAYDLENALNSISTVGLGLQGVVKILTFMVFHKDIRWLVEFQRSVYRAHTGFVGCAERTGYGIMQKWADYSILICKVMAVAIGGMCIAFIGYPIAVYWLTGEKEAIMPIYSPFFDESTSAGFVGMSCTHLVWVVQTLCGITGADVSFILTTIFVLTSVDLFENLFGELNNRLRRNPKLSEARETEEFFINLIRLHQKICLYLSHIKRVFGSICLMDVYANGASMCFIIFCIMFQDYYPHYFMFVAFFVKLLAICLLGTMVEIATDRLLHTIQSSNWYLLPVRMQRSIVVMLARSQNPSILMAGDMPLNLDTFVSVMKNVYKVAMLLSEMID